MFPIVLTRQSLTRITFSPNEEETPAWSPDGREVAYASQKDAAIRALIRRSADGGASAAEKEVWTTTDHFHVTDWSPNGRTILVEAARAGTGSDILAIDVQTGKDTPLLASRYTEGQARLSPDGKWLAYTSDESGRTEAYAQPYPALNARVAISSGGGNEPVWSHDSRKLFFRSTENLMVATVTASGMDFDQPRVLFADRFTRTQGNLHTHFAVSADGRLLAIDQPAGRASSAAESISVILNWSETLKLLAPPKR